MSKTQEEKTWKFDKSGNYYTDLAMKESSNRPTVINEFGYIGLYQVGEATLVDTGYYKKDPKLGQKAGTQYNNDWTGRWTGKNGINTKDQFLANRIVQDIAVREYHKILWERYLPAYHKYEGQEVGGIQLTKSGMISCAHLLGKGGMKGFIESGGKKNEEDGNHVTCAEYLKGFQGYVMDHSIDEHLKKLKSAEPSKPAPLTPVPNSPSISREAAKDLKCANLYNHQRQLREEYSKRLKENRKEKGKEMRSITHILNELATCNQKLTRWNCPKPDKNNTQDKKGNSR